MSNLPSSELGATQATFNSERSLSRRVCEYNFCYRI